MSSPMWSGTYPVGGSSGQLRRGPRRREARVQLAGERRDGDPLLRERVAVAQRDGVVLERLVVDGDAVGRADLVLPAVALADRAALVVLALEPGALERRVDLARALRMALLAQQREHRDLDRRERGVELEHCARVAADVVLVVGVAQEREHRAPDAGGRLDHVRDVALARLLVEVLELLARVL